MKRAALILFCLSCTWILPGAVSADCIAVTYFDNFIIQGDRTVILYNGMAALVKMDVDCSVQTTSRIRLLKNYLCSGDDILIDDSACKIISLTAPGSN
jgi:hypothetical protein